MKFSIDFTPSAANHVRAYRKFEQRTILEGIAAQLVNEPTMATRNRKPLSANELSAWELRIEKYRVFYNVDEQLALVKIVAVGHKEHNMLYIGGREVKL